jgi:hypothetical protein
MNITLEQYMEPMFELSKLKLKHKIHSFINFRLWILDKNNSENKFNNQVLELLSTQFNIDLSKINNAKSIRLDNQILLNFDNYFKWPSLKDTVKTDGFCYGLSSQIAILSSGMVVPCCLDSFGCIDLGSLHNQTLKDILYSKRALDIRDGFKNNIAVEELCQKCTFKNRHTL